MAETHLLQNVIPFALALWWTKQWVMDPIVARWRYVASAIAGAILWIIVAYTSTRVVAPSGGVGHVFGSMALAYFCVFMAFFSLIGMVIGLTVWTEEEGEEASGDLARSSQVNFGD